jgi:hypothetical protein
MNIKDKIEEIVDKVKSDKDFGSKFKEDPIKAVESVLGVDLPDDQIKSWWTASRQSSPLMRRAACLVR